MIYAPYIRVFLFINVLFIQKFCFAGPTVDALCAQARYAWEMDKNSDMLKQKLSDCESNAIKIIKDADDKKIQYELEQAKKPNIKLGMTKNQVLLSKWGEPIKITSLTDAKGIIDNWDYGDGNALYFTNGKLTQIKTTQSK